MAVPLALLHTFVIVARAQSMKAAAGELGVTPGAVSQRVRQLEDRIGQRLFTRMRTGVGATGAGRKLFAEVDQAFRTLETVQARWRPRLGRPRLVVNTIPSFAATWLVPRLASFAGSCPNIDLVVETDVRLIDPRAEPVDLMIRHGLGRYPGLESIWLLAPKLVVVASPDLLRSGPPIHSPADCLRYPLLQDRDRQDWTLWLQAHGVAADGAADGAGEGPSFSDDHLLVRAAAVGQGLALVRDVYADDEIHAGRLVEALDIEWPTAFAYYLVGTQRSFARPMVRRFKQWLLAELGS